MQYCTRPRQWRLKISKQCGNPTEIKEEIISGKQKVIEKRLTNYKYLKEIAFTFI